MRIVLLALDLILHVARKVITDVRVRHAILNCSFVMYQSCKIMKIILNTVIPYIMYLVKFSIII